ncbi:UNVERIFIED_CONTAM: hypothetical protein Scaly_0553400 [Sesamum calycinum]|uniref:Transmembrane protein n=1 Tax=Sesamum calycinum TaxID=2727403 RepID=A0AAW2RTB7_9LAMI
MARAALFRLLRSQSTTFRSGSSVFLSTSSLNLQIFIASENRLAKVHPWPHALSAKNVVNSTLPFAPAQRRLLSRAVAAEDENKISIGPRKGGEEGNDEKEAGIVYYGPISNTIKKVKLLSLSTCCLSVSLGPVITFMTSPDMNVILKGAVASSVIFLSASTTAALHWTIKFADIRPPETNRPFVSFKANGDFYFVDAEHCHNKALLAKLTPQKQARDSAFKNL